VPLVSCLELAQVMPGRLRMPLISSRGKSTSRKRRAAQAVLRHGGGTLRRYSRVKRESGIVFTWCQSCDGNDGLKRELWRLAVHGQAKRRDRPQSSSASAGKTCSFSLNWSRQEHNAVLAVLITGIAHAQPAMTTSYRRRQGAN